jgi:hypothetical protein
VGLRSASNYRSLRLVIQHNWTGAGNSRRSRYRLILYGDSNLYRDFDSMPELVSALRRAGLSVDASEFSAPDPQASSVILSQSVELSDTELESLGLN